MWWAEGGRKKRDSVIFPFINCFFFLFKFTNVNGDLPYEILAVAAKCGLFKKSRYELMIFHVINIFLFECSFTTAKAKGELRVHIKRPGGVIVVFFVDHFEHKKIYRQRAENNTTRSPNQLNLTGEWYHHYLRKFRILSAARSLNFNAANMTTRKRPHKKFKINNALYDLIDKIYGSYASFSNNCNRIEEFTVGW